MANVNNKSVDNAKAISNSNSVKPTEVTSICFLGWKNKVIWKEKRIKRLD